MGRGHTLVLGIVVGALLVGCGSSTATTNGATSKKSTTTSTTLSPGACLGLISGVQSGSTVMTDDAYEEKCGPLPAGVVLAPTTTTTTLGLQPQTFTGNGDNLVDVNLPPDQPGIIHVVGNQSSRYFGVTSYDAAGTQIDSLVNTTEPYDGVRPINFEVGKVPTRLEVKSEGPWTIEVKPLVAARTAPAPGTTTGQGDDVVIVRGSTTSAHIVGNQASRYFGVTTYDTSSDNVVNTTDPYDGRVMLSDPSVVEVRAEGSWSIQFE